MRNGVNNKRYHFITIVWVCVSILAFVSPLPVYSAGAVAAWGYSDYVNVPSPNVDFNAVSAGVYHSLGLKGDGSIVAWGNNTFGQCTVPEPNTDFKAIAAGYGHSLGLKNNGTIAAWGYNVNGECNVPSPNADFKAIAANGTQSIGLKNNGSIVAWGYNGDNLSTVPSPNTNFKAIAIGWSHALGLKNDGSVVAWGNNAFGQCDVPSPNTDFNAVSASYGHSLGLKNDGSIVAWGRNESGECDVPSPNTDFIAISAGYDFSLGLKSDGSVAGWGYNANGQYNVPSPNEDFASISAGTYHSLGLKGSNNVTVIQFGNIPGQKNTKLILTDCDGNNVTFSLTGGGYGEIDACDCTFSTITLFDTTEKSALTISTKGKVHTSVGNIICNGPMKSITAKTAKLSGDITIGSALNPKSAVTIAFDRTDDLDINSEMPIKSITATDWTGGSINAPSVSGIAIKGDKKRSIAGNLDIDVNVDGAIGTVNVAGWLESPWDCCSVKSITAFRAYDFYLTLHQKPDPKILALGKLTIKEGFYWSRIISSGNIGTFTVAAMRQSSCFAGVADACSVDLNADDVCDLPPVLDDTFNQTATIKSIMIKGIKGDDATYFVNSNIAAANILSVSMAYPAYTNDAPFGISMFNNPPTFKKLTIKDADGTHSWKGTDIGTAIDWLSAISNNKMQIRKD